MQHVRQLEIVHERVPPGHLRGQIGPLQRLADIFVLAGVLDWRFRIGLDIEALAAYEIAIGDSAAVVRAHDAIGNAQLLDRNRKPFGGELEERLACGRRSLTHFHAGGDDGGAAAGPALIGCQRRVAIDHDDALVRNVELFGDDLPVGGAQARAEIDPTAVERDLAVRCDGEERIDRVVGDVS